MPPQTLEEWRDLASRKLDVQATRAAGCQAYYDGDFPIRAILDTEERQTFRQFLRQAGANWCALIVNAVAERLQAVGFRFGEGGSDRAWQIWQASRMDADAELVQTDALVAGSSFTLVQRDDDNPTGVEITPESPLETTVLYEPGNRRRRAAGYKRFKDDEDTVEVLILPDTIATWYPREAVPEVVPNSAGTVNLVEVIPQPQIAGPARSELAEAMDFQDRINTTIFNRMVATDYGAFRQVWASGAKLRRQVIRNDDGSETVEVSPPFQIGANRLLVNEDPNGRFGAIPESTLEGYLRAVEQDVNQLAAITQTPPHYLLGKMVNLSADAIKAAEAGLVSKVTRRAVHIGEAWEEVMRIALGLVGDPATVDVSAEVIWKDFETRSEGQRVDALTKMKTLDVPTEVLWQRWGATPQEITRWRQMNAETAAQAATTQAQALGATDVYAQLLAGVGGTP